MGAEDIQLECESVFGQRASRRLTHGGRGERQTSGVGRRSRVNLTANTCRAVDHVLITCRAPMNNGVVDLP